MNKVLIIRSCNNAVIDDLLKYIYINYYSNELEIYCMVQENICEIISNKYRNLKIIKVENGRFDFNRYRKNRKLFNELKAKKFDCIFIPSSYNDFYGFEEVFMIASTLKTDKVLLFNVNNKIFYKKIYFFKEFAIKYIINIFYIINVPIIIIFVIIVYSIFKVFYLLKKYIKKLIC
ncbi:Uncharacterised protein [Clostridium carnis]|uniref:Glycosyltransferase n=1 Tax=Clostridium carnis TaxID=1530 RepID=A0ABY6SUZ1_9CLOT|nr:hypothetical protein [Clostridium carnis]VDG72437.1 Uncharacterised protein [Clostridium carnis]